MTQIKSKLTIESNRYLIVENGEDLGYKKQLDFNLDLQDVCVLGLSGSMSLDDEALYINLIDLAGTIYSVNSYLVTEEFYKYLENSFYFKKTDFIKPEEFYNKNKSEVIYPLELKGNILFKRLGEGSATIINWFKRRTRITYYTDFILSDKISIYLKKIT